MEMSNERIERYIDELLADEAVNQQLIPDMMERAMYRNVLRLSVRLLERIVNETEVQVLGHRIRMTLEPDDS